MLSVDRVSLSFDAKAALDRFSLAVDDGEVVALLGPSGCGKTSLLRVVAGLTPPDAGRVVLDGRDLVRVPIHQRGIGLMFQDYALFPHRDVAANVAFGLRMRGDAPAARRSRVAEVLELVGLGGFGARAVGTLSGGERQRVALARALAPAPALLMLDEPLGALDRTLRDRLVLELSELFAELAIGVVYVTHDQSEALALADRVVVMDHGREVQEGPPAEVWAAPHDAFVAQFLGLVNVFRATLVDGRADLGWTLLDLGGDEGASQTSVEVLIRPEAVHLVEAIETAETAEGVEGVEGVEGAEVDGEVEAVAFRGDHTQVWVRLSTGERLEARRSGPGRLAVGTPVRATIEPSGVHRLGSSPTA